jgi:3-methyladenine DNA glycosylase AlkD
MEIMNILEELNNLAEESYKEFNNKIIPTKQKTLGVRIPALRKLAKEIAKDDPMSFIQMDKQNIYEMIMLEGMTLSYWDKSFIELLPLTERFLNKVDNWAQIDSTVCNYKNIKKEEKDVLKIVKIWLKSDKEFVVRAGLVILLAHYVEKKNLNTIFKLSQGVKHTGYYVYMANAWLISQCMAKFPEETTTFLENNTLNKRTHNKAIQKSRESYRVSKEYKEIINQLKKKQ